MTAREQHDRSCAPGLPDISSICIVRLSALGDVIMALPLIKMLRREWPRAKITWIISDTYLPAVAFLEKEGVEFVAIKKPRGIHDYLALRRWLAGRQFDVLLCAQANWRANLIYPCIHARRKIGYGRDRAKDMHGLFVRETLTIAPPHIVDGLLQFGEKLGGTRSKSDVEGSWGLEITPEALSWAGHILPKTAWLAVAPCSSKVERDWSPESWAKVIAHAWDAHRMPAVLLSGASERDRNISGAILQTVPASIPVLDLTGKTDIARLIAAIGHCAVLLAADTGAVHIARALARPVVGLYAVAPASRTGPYRQIEYCVDKYDEALQLIVGKNRTEVPWDQRVHDTRAMQLIKYDEVCGQLDRAIKYADTR